ncbi:glycosyltransferase family 4 protein [Anabaenopsis sp. FSS-46]|uniref:glycosyltransferase family 4 protein n=1 Tax=Anabaenopsis sp. FSS-46 TaxID=2971766 RepID=UPI00247453E0|nr:glycosyltransferase family 4 protein [Anabaenopsis sp. FSS-46]MDH6100721.1 glycosyltransferase family 4 protein [Anabaenopsis sp. FSS-46]
MNNRKITPLKIAIVVHGRFHAFDLARELINQGHDVTLFTNYPKYIVEKFGIPKKSVRSFVLHGIITRIFNKLRSIFSQLKLDLDFEQVDHAIFSNWAAKKLLKEEFDVTYVFSGIAEEIFHKNAHKPFLKILARGSSHIKTQFQILKEEEERVSIKIDKPSPWIISKEEREYQLADLVFVLSSFAYQSFLEQGFNHHKLRLMLSGNQTEKFRPESLRVINERVERIITNQPLRVLMVGTFSYRKGASDLEKIISAAGNNFQFRFIGSISDETKNLLSRITAQKYSHLEFINRQPHFKLPMFYAWGDVFIFPTIEDGYPAVLAQAHASGLPIIATTNCSAPDIIVENQTGWVVPIRRPDAFVEKLQWCHEHREELAAMARRVYQDFQPRDWTEVAQDFTKIVRDYLQQAEN